MHTHTHAHKRTHARMHAHTHTHTNKTKRDTQYIPNYRSSESVKLLWFARKNHLNSAHFNYTTHTHRPASTNYWKGTNYEAIKCSSALNRSSRFFAIQILYIFLKIYIYINTQNMKTKYRPSPSHSLCLMEEKKWHKNTNMEHSLLHRNARFLDLS